MRGVNRYEENKRSTVQGISRQEAEDELEV